MTDEILERINAIAPPGWRHRIDVGHGIVTPGRENSLGDVRRLAIPDDLSGKRVLDIGCSDGYFSFECERRGALVTAIDDFTSTPYNDGQHGFKIAAELLNSKARFVTLSVYDIDQLEEEYDVILLLNVLYHLRHPALALDLIYEKLAPGGLLLLKSYFHQDIRFKKLGFGFDLTKLPLGRFFESNELNNDPSNWWGLNWRCIEAMLRSAGYKNVTKTAQHMNRIYYSAEK